MWIVKLALLRPYTFVVMSLMLVIGGVGMTIKLPKDIFPAIKEPTVTILWRYPGVLGAQDGQRDHRVERVPHLSSSSTSSAWDRATSSASA